jgi:hypothetical protein
MQALFLETALPQRFDGEPRVTRVVLHQQDLDLA